MKAFPLLLSQLLMIFVFSSAPDHAFSQELPNYDFDAQCRTPSAVKQGLPDKVLEECLTRQNDFYTAAKAEWKSLPANVKKDCGNVAVSDGPGSYGLLETCIRQYISGTK